MLAEMMNIQILKTFFKSYEKTDPFSSWPLVGNDGINLYIGILGIHSLIPY